MKETGSNFDHIRKSSVGLRSNRRDPSLLTWHLETTCSVLFCKKDNKLTRHIHRTLNAPLLNQSWHTKNYRQNQNEDNS